MFLKDLENLMESITEWVRLFVRTAVTGTVDTYNASTQSGTLIQDVAEQASIDDDLVSVKIPPVSNVPVLHLGSSQAGLTFGLDQGDRVVLLQRHRSGAEVDSGAQPDGGLTPGSDRRMSPQDYVALPAYHPPGEQVAAARFRSDGQPVFWMAQGSQLHIGSSTAAKPLSSDPLVQQELSRIWDFILDTNPLTGLYGALSASIPSGAWTPPVGGPFPPGPNPTASNRAVTDD